MDNFSYWERKHFWHYWDFTVIGGGITGLTSAIYIKRANPNAKVTVLERGVLPSGASTKNAGFACFGSVSEILDDLEHMREADVFNLIQLRYNGLGKLRELLPDDKLGLTLTGGYEIFEEAKSELYSHCLGSLSYINAELVNVIGKQAFWDDSADVAKFGLSGIKHMIVNREEGILDTGLMMKNLNLLARESGVNIFNGVQVNSVSQSSGGALLETSAGEVRTGTCVVATNGLARQLLPELDVSPCRAQVLITSPIADLKLNGAFHHDKGYNYFRNIDNRVLLGGGRHTGKESENTTEMDTTKEIQSYLENLLREYILKGKTFTIDHRWSGIMGMGKTKSVILERTDKNIICAVRLGGMGVALGSQLGYDVAELATS
ncbi:MAG: NAD(P)/FAD-dependent oxidoreductase [Cryomorphaceae bacterium]|nr:FAD-binding oxidoreductase [Flavobacteriales bacterium]